NNNPGQYTPTAAVSAFYWGGSGVPAGGPPTDTTPPSVAVTSPSGGSTVNGTITINATAADNVGVASVQFQLDNGNFGSPITSAPYSLPWDTTKVANGSHTVAAVARDAAGNSSTASVAVNVSNSTTPPPPPPPSTGTAVSFLGFDTTTKGNWKGVYGQDGNFIAQHSYNAP